MKIKKGDFVQIITGKDKGKQGKIIQCLPNINKVVVEGANKLIKYLKAQQKNSDNKEIKGQKIEFSAPIHVSNVMLVCPNTKKLTRIGYKNLEDGSKKRYSKKSLEIIQ